MNIQHVFLTILLYHNIAELCIRVMSLQKSEHDMQQSIHI